MKEKDIPALHYTSEGIASGLKKQAEGLTSSMNKLHDQVDNHYTA